MEMRSLHLDRDWLYLKYVTEGLSTYQIGKIVERNPKNVYQKLVDFGIPTRPRGLNLKNGDCYMMQENVVNPFSGRQHTEETKRILSKKASCEKPHLRGKRNGMSGRTGESNPHFIDGSSPERQRLYASGVWKEFVRNTLKRDGYKCVRCGAAHQTTNALHAHHIKAWAGNKELRFNADNVITLCKKCHNWVHSKQNADKDYII